MPVLFAPETAWHLGDDGRYLAPKRQGDVVRDLGHYFETYDKPEGKWLFTNRRWHSYIGGGCEGAVFPTGSPKGREALDDNTQFGEIGEKSRSR
jgi:hypothetical protein